MSTAALQEWATRIAFGIVGTIHLLALLGVSGRNALEKFYGIPVDSPELQLLLQHRAVLFGLLGTAALISTCSFMLLAWMASGTNGAITRVVLADGVAIAALLVALFIHLFRTH